MEEYFKQEDNHYHKGLTMQEYRELIEKRYERPYHEAIELHRKRISQLEKVINEYSD